MRRPHARFATSHAAAARPLFAVLRTRFFRGTSLAASVISHAGGRFSRAFSLTKNAELATHLATQAATLREVEGGNATQVVTDECVRLVRPVGFEPTTFSSGG